MREVRFHAGERLDVEEEVGVDAGRDGHHEQRAHEELAHHGRLGHPWQGCEGQALVEVAKAHRRHLIETRSPGGHGGGC